MNKPMTYKQLINELKKFDPNWTAMIIAGVNLNEEQDESANYIDGAGVKKVNYDPAKKTVSIIVGDSGTMTYGMLVDQIRSNVPLDDIAVLKIGYGTFGKYDMNDDIVFPRLVNNCTVIDGDDIWNIDLGDEPDEN